MLSIYHRAWSFLQSTSTAMVKAQLHASAGDATPNFHNRLTKKKKRGCSPSVLKSANAGLGVAFLPPELAALRRAHTPRAASSTLPQVPRPDACLLPPSSVPPGRKGKTRREASRASSRLRHVPGGGGKCAPEGQCRLGDENAQVRLQTQNRTSLEVR